MQLPNPYWAAEPDLLFDEDFTALLAAGVTAVGATAPEPLFDSHDQCWQVSTYGATAGTGAVAAVDTSLTGVRGVVALQTGGATSNTIALFSARDAVSPLPTEGVIAAKKLAAFEALINITATSSFIHHIGFSADVSQDFSAGGGGHAVYFIVSSQFTNIQVVCRASGAGGPVDTGIARSSLLPGRIALYAQQKARASWEFYINRRRVAEISTNQPTADLLFGAWTQTLAGAAKLITVDRARAWTTSSARWGGP